MLQHYVFIKYRKDTTSAHIEDFCTRMLALRSSIKTIKKLDIGRDILHETRSWDLVLIMTFASIEALRGYQQHPDHKKVMAFNQPCVADVGSVDFFSAQPGLQMSGNQEPSRQATGQ